MDAHDGQGVWLTAGDEKRWQELLRSTPVATLTAVLSFYSVHLILPRLARSTLIHMSAATRVRVEHRCVGRRSCHKCIAWGDVEVGG